MRPLVIVPFLVSATQVTSTILPLNRRQQDNPKPITLTKNGVIFEVEVQVNNQTFYLIPDTGSSDLWVPVSDFQCVDGTSGNEVPQEDCHFGGTYQVPNSTEYVSNQTFGVQYGTGIALGKVAYADVTFNGFKIEHQKIGLVDRTDDMGDGLGSGVLGLGFPPLTSAHPGTELDNSTLLLNRAVYDPVFVGMYKKGLVEPWYSFALERPPKNATSGPGGWFGLGELPPVAFADDWAIKPIEVTEGLPEVLTGGERLISLMTMTVDGVTWRNSSLNSTITNTTAFQAVVDTGNHMNLLPTVIAEAINNAFNPPGVFDESSSVYVVDCNCTTPELGIILDGHTFWHQRPEDLIYRDISGVCYSSVGRIAEGSGVTVGFLGDAFLRNVVSVFDFGKEEMRFAARSDGNMTISPSPFPSPISTSAAIGSASPSQLFVLSALAMVIFF
ncbi:Nn.00g006120.m01.CDS01 [Neocucurbitaria sp. VM-36]